VQIEVSLGIGWIFMVFSSRFKHSLRLIVSVSDRRLYFMKCRKKERKKEGDKGT